MTHFLGEIMKLALCDDSRYDMDNLKALLDGYHQIGKMEQISEYSSAEELLGAVKGGAEFEIIITDISLPEQSGIELGRELNEISPDTQIIFVSGNPEYFQDVYYVEHIQFMSKPVEAERLYYALDKAMSRCVSEYITVGDKQNRQRIDKRMIIFVEASNHDTIVYSPDGRAKYHMPFGEFIELLGNDRFIRCHRGFMVNMEHVTRLEAKSIIVRGGADVPVGRTYSADVKEKILKFWGDSI